MRKRIWIGLPFLIAAAAFFVAGALRYRVDPGPALPILGRPAKRSPLPHSHELLNSSCSVEQDHAPALAGTPEPNGATPIQFTIRGWVVDERDAPRQSARIEVRGYHPSGHRLGYGRIDAVSDEHGYFEAPVSMDFRAHTPFVDIELFAWMTPYQAMTQAVVRNVADGSVIYPVTLVLPSPASVTGRVVDSVGRPIPDVEVSLLNTDPRPEKEDRPRAVSDSAGHFTFDAVAPGRWRLRPGNDHRLAYDLGGSVHVLPGQSLRVPDIVLLKNTGIRFTVTPLVPDGGGCCNEPVWIEVALSTGETRKTSDRPQKDGSVTIWSREELPLESAVGITVFTYEGCHRSAKVPVRPESGELVDLGTISLTEADRQ